jgi:hypothetical protein
MVPESQDSESLAMQPLVPNFIGYACGVLPTIDFNYHLVFEAHKIDDKASDRYLSSKLCSGKAVSAEVIPQPPFSVGHLISQSLRV